MITLRTMAHLAILLDFRATDKLSVSRLSLLCSRDSLLAANHSSANECFMPLESLPFKVEDLTKESPSSSNSVKHSFLNNSVILNS